MAQSKLPGSSLLLRSHCSLPFLPLPAALQLPRVLFFLYRMQVRLTCVRDDDQAKHSAFLPVIYVQSPFLFSGVGHVFDLWSLSSQNTVN